MWQYSCTSKFKKKKHPKESHATQKNQEIKTTERNIWIWRNKSTSKSLNCNMLTGYSLNHWGDEKCLENQAREKRRESKQTTELTAMFATDMHVIWLGRLLPPTVIRIWVNVPQEHMQVIHHSHKIRAFQRKSHCNDTDRSNGFSYKLWINAKKKIIIIIGCLKQHSPLRPQNNHSSCGHRAAGINM